MQEKQSQTFSKQLRERMAALEKRDWELWILALLMLAVLAAGFLLVLLPSFLRLPGIPLKVSDPRRC